jgi:hypothetical protein
MSEAEDTKKTQSTTRTPKGDERRVHTRVYLFGGRVEITKKNGKKFSARSSVLNVSNGGIFLRLACPAKKFVFFTNKPAVEDEDLLHFELFLPPKYEPLQLGGQIVRVERIDKEQIGVGICFSEEYSNPGTLETIEKTLRGPVKKSQKLKATANERERHSARVKKINKEKKVAMASRRLDRPTLTEEIKKKSNSSDQVAVKGSTRRKRAASSAEMNTARSSKKKRVDSKKSDSTRTERKKGDSTRTERKKSDSTRTERKKGDSSTRTERKKRDSTRTERKKGDSTRTERKKRDSTRTERKKRDSTRLERKKGDSTRLERKKRGSSARLENPDSTKTSRSKRKRSSTRSLAGSEIAYAS